MTAARSELTGFDRLSVAPQRRAFQYWRMPIAVGRWQTSILRAVCALAVGGCSEPGSGALQASPPPRQEWLEPDAIGVYFWGADETSLPPGMEVLDWGAEQVHHIGSRTIRVTLGPADAYRVNGGATTLVDIATGPAYRRLFEDPGFSTYLLTAYSARDLQSVWADGYDDTEAAEQEKEIRALGAHLLATYRDKTFIVLNWEGDNALAGVGATAAAVSGFRDWIAARARAVSAARDGAPASSSHLYSGVEFNRVFGCDAAPCVITDVAPYVGVDYYSYSSYEAINGPIAGLGSTLESALETAFDTIRARRPDAERHQLILGELGFAREAPIFGECDAARRVVLTAQTARSWGVQYAIHWQVIDNGLRPVDLDATSVVAGNTFVGFGLYKWDGTISLAGRALTALLADDPSGAIAAANAVIAAAGDCPSLPEGAVTAAGPGVQAGGVVRLRRDAGASLGGASTVHVTQPDRRFALRDGSPMWDESADEISFQLPADLLDGLTVVYVTDGAGLDSNGSLVDIAPPAAPPVCSNGVVEAGEQCDGGTCCTGGCQFSTAACAGGVCQSGTCRPKVAAVVDGAVNAPTVSPDSVLSIYGTFSSSSNQVRIRSVVGSWFTVGSGSAFWYESAGQINVQIPPYVFSGGGGTGEVAVVNQLGQTSSSYAFGVCGQGSAACCVASTACDQTYDGAGVHYCRNMRWDVDGDGVTEWAGYQWITASTAASLCNDPAETGSTQAVCGGQLYTCCSSAYAPGASCP